MSVTVATADDGFILQNPYVMLLDDGRLVVLATHNRYQSDAVQTDVEAHWYVSEDGGETWRLESGGATALGVDARVFLRNGAPVPAVELPDGMLITSGSVGWENHEESDRGTLEEEGYYIFDDSEGNAEGVLSISHRF